MPAPPTPPPDPVEQASSPRLARLQVEVSTDIDQVDPKDWNAFIAPSDLFAQHAFVRICQRSEVENARYRHLVIRDDEQVVACATLSALSVRLDLLTHPRLQNIAAALRKIYPKLLRLPVVLGGLPVSFGQSSLRIRGAEYRQAVVAHVVDEAQGFADQLGAPIICFKEFSPSEQAIGQALEQHDFFQCPSLPAYHLELPYSQSAGYEAAMRAGYRRQLRASRRGLSADGFELKIAELEESIGSIFSLYEQVMDRAEFHLDRLNRAFIEQLAISYGDRSRVLVICHHQKPIAASVTVIQNGRASYLITGIDPQYRTVYPSLVAAVIEDAISQGVQGLEMGQTSDALKTRYGAQPLSRDLYIRSNSPLLHRTLRWLSPVMFPKRTTPKRRVFRQDTVG